MDQFIKIRGRDDELIHVAIQKIIALLRLDVTHDLGYWYLKKTRSRHLCVKNIGLSRPQKVVTILIGYVLMGTKDRVPDQFLRIFL